MSPNQLPPQNTIALATTGMEREKERLGKRWSRDAEQDIDRRHEGEEEEMKGGLG